MSGRVGILHPNRLTSGDVTEEYGEFKRYGEGWAIGAIVVGGNKFITVFTSLRYRYIVKLRTRAKN